jgi:hypothetical protein
MTNYKSQNLAKTALWQHFMDNVVCLHPCNCFFILVLKDDMLKKYCKGRSNILISTYV